MGSSMGRYPPAPVQGDVFARAFLNGHLVALEWEIDQEMAEYQQDQQVQRLIDWNQSVLHTKAPEEIHPGRSGGEFNHLVHGQSPYFSLSLGIKTPHQKP